MVTKGSLLSLITSAAAILCALMNAGAVHGSLPGPEASAKGPGKALAQVSQPAATAVGSEDAAITTASVTPSTEPDSLPATGSTGQTGTARQTGTTRTEPPLSPVRDLDEPVSVPGEMPSEPAAPKEAGEPLPDDDDDVMEGEEPIEAKPTEIGDTVGPLEGDDELPTRQETEDNPYITPTAPSSLEAGERVSGEQDVTGAFVPPTEPEITQEGDSARGVSEMVGILGEEIYNRRVNITTPPDTEVAEVVRLLAERANLNFVYPEGLIRGRITLNLRDVPLGVALQSILSTHGLAMVREGENVMRIVSIKDLEPSGGGVETRTIYVRLNWVTAPSILPTLQNVRGGKGAGSVKSHKESNTLILTDTPTNIQLMRDLISQIDVPTKQVMIEARMAELLITNGRALGSDITLERFDSSGNSPVTGRPTGPNALLPVDNVVSSLLAGGGAPQVNFGGVVSIFGREFDVAATLDALEDRRVANVLANPRIITLNNQEAEIDIKREIPYLEAQQGVSQGVVAATVKFKDAGVRLRVLPTITNNGFVKMRLEPEQLIVAGQFAGPTGNIPIIDRRSAVTNVIVKDEDTVVLGGLREIDSGESKRQFPWLGQAPIIGHFFKNSSKSFLKNDLMLFVTPHIVKAPVMAPAENYKYTRIDAHWDLPDFFFDESIENRENRHRGEADHTSRSYIPETLKLPPVNTGAAGAEEAEGMIKSEDGFK